MKSYRHYIDKQWAHRMQKNPITFGEEVRRPQMAQHYGQTVPSMNLNLPVRPRVLLCLLMHK